MGVTEENLVSSYISHNFLVLSVFICEKGTTFRILSIQYINWPTLVVLLIHFILKLNLKFRWAFF